MCPFWRLHHACPPEGSRAHGQGLQQPPAVARRAAARAQGPFVHGWSWQSSLEMSRREKSSNPTACSTSLLPSMSNPERWGSRLSHRQTWAASPWNRYRWAAARHHLSLAPLFAPNLQICCSQDVHGGHAALQAAADMARHGSTRPHSAAGTTVQPSPAAVQPRMGHRAGVECQWKKVTLAT